jgi:hypothetical protein
MMKLVVNPPVMELALAVATTAPPKWMLTVSPGENE